jgi:N-methylhydantoinase B
MIEAPRPKSLRDLDTDAFSARYGTDRFTATLMANRFRYVVRHMCAHLLHTAFSPILRDTFDFATTVSGPAELNYPMCAVSNSLLLFSGTMGDAVRNAVEEFGPENLAPGDVLMVNDPYRVGNHVNDLSAIRPVFHGGRLVSFLVMRAHQFDMGGITPGGFSGSKRNVYESGLVIPPTLLYRNDKPVKSAYHLILDNARFGAMLLPDLKSLYQGLLIGERLLTETIARYGVDAFWGGMRYACDISAEQLGDAIEERIPDGIYDAEEYIDADGVDESLTYRIQLKIAKVGRNVEVDFSGTSAQARTCINCAPLDAKSAVAIAIKLLVDPKTPFTSGTFRNIDIVLPPGTIVSATPPDGAVFLYWEASMPVVAAVLRALARALGEGALAGDCGGAILHNANGVGADGAPWVAIAQGGANWGPWGGTQSGDADSCQVHRTTNLIDGSVETSERDYPLVILRRDYVADSCGRGRHRGGAANLTDVLWLTDAEHLAMPLHVKTSPSFGAHGGAAGTMPGCWLFATEEFDIAKAQSLVPLCPSIYGRATPVGGHFSEVTNLSDPGGKYFYFGREQPRLTKARSIFRYRTAGGGGWGDPWSRDPELVKRDVRDEYVSVAGALRDYGVVAGDPQNDPEGLEIDWQATRAARDRKTSSGDGAL